MGSIYLPATIDTPKKEIIRYEGGYIRNIYGTLIGRYDDKYVYDGSSSLNINFIGRMQFNYGYLSSRNEIFVISHRDGSLSVDNNRYVAFFDGDETGALAAFMLAYTKGMISISSGSSSVNTTDYSNYGSGSKIKHESSGDNVPEPGVGLNGCLGVIFTSIFVIAAIYSSCINWWDIVTTPISEKMIQENWVAILPIISMIIGTVIAIISNNSILSSFTAPFVIQIIVGAILYAIYTQSAIIGFALGLLAATVASIVPFVIGIIIAYIIKKRK